MQTETESESERKAASEVLIESAREDLQERAYRLHDVESIEQRAEKHRDESKRLIELLKQKGEGDPLMDIDEIDQELVKVKQNAIEQRSIEMLRKSRSPWDSIKALKDDLPLDKIETSVDELVERAGVDRDQLLANGDNRDLDRDDEASLLGQLRSALRRDRDGDEEGSR